MLDAVSPIYPFTRLLVESSKNCHTFTRDIHIKCESTDHLNTEARHYS